MLGNEKKLVRPAQIADALQIAHVHVESWRTAYRGLISDAILQRQSVERRSAFWHERLAQAKGSVLVAEDEQGVCGFCDLIPSRDKDAATKSAGELAALYILSSHWRRGIGRALCKKALAEARRQASSRSHSGFWLPTFAQSIFTKRWDSSSTELKKWKG